MEPNCDKEGGEKIEEDQGHLEEYHYLFCL